MTEEMKPGVTYRGDQIIDLDNIPRQPAHLLSELGDLGAGDWLNGKAPGPRKALLEVPTEDGPKMFLPSGKTAMLVAPGGTGKTSILTQLALSIATGKKWLDTFEVASPGRVLLALGEEDADEMHRRIYYSARLMDLDADARQAAYSNLHVMPMYGANCGFVADQALAMPGEIETGESAFYTQFKALLKERGPWEAIIIDPASRIMGADAEIDNAKATRFVELLERLTKAPGNPTVLIAHHTNKAATREARTDQTAARGSSALTDGVRWQVNMDRCEMPGALADRNRADLRLVKTNYGPRVKALGLIRDRDGWRPATKYELQEEKTARDAEKTKKKDGDNDAADSGYMGVGDDEAATSEFMA
jgi:RecA-family ATPase